MQPVGMLFGMWTSGPMEPCSRWGSGSSHRNGTLGFILGHTQACPHSISATWFARGHQWCGLWLPVVYQLVSSNCCLHTNTHVPTFIVTGFFSGVVVVVECIYQPYVFSRSVAMLSAECSCCSPPSSLVCGQLLTTCDIVWHLVQGHMSVAVRPHFFWQDAQWPWLV